MRRIFHLLASILLVSSIALSTAYAAPGLRYSDEWFEGRIGGALDYNPYLYSSDLMVESEGSAITLTGRVPSEVERQLAADIARSVDGVGSVTNKIKIDPTVNNDGGASLRQAMEDATTTAAVKSKLIANKGTHGFAIDVSTIGNVVTLRGSVASKDEKALAERIAFNSGDVREVRNQLTIDGTHQTSTKGSESSTTPISDAWISTKVRTLLAFSSDFPGSDIDVTTTNGTITLNGVARTPTQKEQIASTIMDVAGVKSVENNLVVRRGGA